MKVLFAASEGVPYSKTGGLADVLGVLPKEVEKWGVESAVVLPYYKSTQDLKLNPFRIYRGIHVPLGKDIVRVNALEIRVPACPRVFLIQYAPFFRRIGFYVDEKGRDYPDNHRRFALFSRAVLELLDVLSFNPDIIHCHDWQTGLIPLYLKHYRKKRKFRSLRTVLTIHNLAYQGVFPRKVLPAVGIPKAEFDSGAIDFYGKVSFLKAGLIHASWINTVSPTYAQETLQAGAKGGGLDGVLKSRGDHYVGILNGIDVRAWNPQRDRYLYANFSSKNIKPRKECRRNLLKKCGLTTKEDVPLLGFVGRLDWQKGVDILLQIIPTLVKERCRFVLLGRGDPRLQKKVNNVRRAFPHHVFVENQFSESLAHKIYAGCDLFLMPSRFEPCGLGQLIAMRYGGLPVVMPTGGLLDTVTPLDGKGHGNGMVATDETPRAFLKAVRKGLGYLRERSDWARWQKRAMTLDFSWASSAKKYSELYRSALKESAGDVG